MLPFRRRTLKRNTRNLEPQPGSKHIPPYMYIFWHICMLKPFVCSIPIYIYIYVCVYRVTSMCIRISL